MYVCYSQCNYYPLYVIHTIQPLSMTEEPDAVIDCYLAISLDSLVLICDQGKVFHVVSVIPSVFKGMHLVS